MAAPGLTAYEQALHQLANASLIELRQLWSLLGRGATEFPVEVKEALIEALPVLIDQYGQVAQDLTIEWYNALDVNDGFKANPPPPIPREQVAASALWAAQPLFDPDGVDVAAVLQRASGSMSRYVYNSARETVWHNAELEELGGVARVTRADGCGYCRMLASRGFAYRSEGTAEAGSHDHCRCVVLPRKRGISDKDIPNLDKFANQYREAVDQIGGIDGAGSTEKIIAVMNGGTGERAGEKAAQRAAERRAARTAARNKRSRKS